MKKIWIQLIAVVLACVAPWATIAAETRTVSHPLGESTIPVKPQRIVALRDDSVATPLLDMGAPLIGVVGRTHAQTGERYIRGATHLLGVTFDNTGLVDIGDQNAPDLEVITELNPDLIIIMPWQAEQYEALSRIAPTVQITPNLTFFDHLEHLADLAGVRASFEERRQSYDEKVAQIRAALGDPSAITVAQFNLWEDGVSFYPWGAASQVMRDIGYSVPDIIRPAMDEPTLNAKFSLESLDQFAADVTYTTTAVHFGQTAESLKEMADKAMPAWRSLPSVKSGQHFYAPRDEWHGYAFKSLELAADGLALMTVGRF